MEWAGIVCEAPPSTCPDWRSHVGWSYAAKCEEPARCISPPLTSLHKYTNQSTQTHSQPRRRSCGCDCIAPPPDFHQHAAASAGLPPDLAISTTLPPPNLLPSSAAASSISPTPSPPVPPRTYSHHRYCFDPRGPRPVGSGPRYMICVTLFARCASQTTHGHARIARVSRASPCPCPIAPVPHTRTS